MRPTPVVMSDPLLEDLPEMSPVQGDQVIQALPSDGPDGSLADRISLRAPVRRLDHTQTHVFGRGIEFPRENPDPVMDEEAVGMVSRNGLVAPTRMSGV